MRRLLSPAFGIELLILITLGAPFNASFSIGLFIRFLDPCNRRNLYELWAEVERSLRKRSNHAPARFANTRAGHLTIFMACRLPYYFACSWPK